MYNNYFGFSEAPFSISPDPRFLYMSERHRDALAHLIYGAGENGGFVLLTGEVGTGKTTLIRALLAQKIENVDAALCLHSGLTVIDFIASILDELHIDYPSDTNSLKQLIDALNGYLLNAHAKGRQTIVIIDEAQNLSREVLEQVRLLTNLETDRQKLLRIVLVGQEELLDIIERDDLRQLSQRITARYHLSALNEQETKEYIQHRLHIVKGSPAIISPGAAKKVYQMTKGVPRLINVLCDRALLTAYNQDEHTVSATHVRQAATETLPMLSRRHHTKRINNNLKWGIGGAALLLTLGWGSYAISPQISQLIQAINTPKATITDKKSINKSADVPRETSNNSSLVTAKQTKSNNGSINTGKDIKVVEKPQTPPPVPKLSKRDIQQGAGSEFAGMMNLAKQWKLNTDMPANKTLCGFVETQSMLCTEIKANIPLLKRLNRPVLLEILQSNGRRAWLPIVGFGNSHLDCIINGNKKQCPLGEIVQIWSGRTKLLLNKPNVNVRIRPNFYGEQVQWLRQRIAIYEGKDYTAINASLRYDKALVERVKKFQMNYNLVSDGVVGNKTLLYLYNVITNENTPTLINNQ